MSFPAAPMLPTGSPAAARTSRSFWFGAFVLCPERQSLLHRGAPVRIGGRALDLLTALVERPGELIDKRDLVSRAWPSTFVDAANLKVNMASLRRALGESHAEPQYIATVVGRGYRFVAPVHASASNPVLLGDPDLAGDARIAGLLNALDGIRRELQQLGAYRPEAEA